MAQNLNTLLLVLALLSTQTFTTATSLKGKTKVQTKSTDEDFNEDSAFTQEEESISKSGVESLAHQSSPPSPVYYYQGSPSWFGINGLTQYYGTYCQQNRIVDGGASSSHPGYKFLYYTCDQCASIKNKYLSHPIGLIFGMNDRPQRVLYIKSSGIVGYRCK